jgi:hypothetical protein
MEYHFCPPFFEIAPDLTFADAWESFCCQAINLDNHTTEVRRRTPPDQGVDLFWQSAKTAYQCKAVENGSAGAFPLAGAIGSLKKALEFRTNIGWDNYYVCTNVIPTGSQEDKLREVFSGVCFLTPSYWYPLCQRFHHEVASRFRLLVRIQEPSVLQAVDHVFLSDYATRLSTSLKADPLLLLVYSNRRRDIFEVPVSLNFTIDDVLEILISLFGLPNQRDYSEDGVSVSLSYSIVINEKKVPLNKTLSEVGITDRSIITLLKTIVWRDQSGKTDVHVIECLTAASLERRMRSPQQRANAALEKFKKEIDAAFEKRIAEFCDTGEAGRIEHARNAEGRP